MRPRDVRVPLWEIARAAGAIGSFVQGRSLADYESDLMLRSAVERQLEIVGEAMKRALVIEPALEERLADARGVVDFRNVIAHDYDRLSDHAVWDLAVEHLPAFAAEVDLVLKEREGDG